jgi:hypothetical protein
VYQVAAKGGTTQPTSPGAYLDRADRDYGRDAGLPARAFSGFSMPSRSLQAGPCLEADVMAAGSCQADGLWSEAPVGLAGRVGPKGGTLAELLVADRLAPTIIEHDVA